MINERVCEGCGDCGVKSNCMSVEPVKTEFGRKTRILQPSCNKDFSCVKGFCQSFLTFTPKPESIETAIRQAGVAVDMSLASFRWGRLAVVPALQLSASALANVDSVGAQGETKRLLEVRVPELIDYQDDAYAKRYADVVRRVMAAERSAAAGKSGLSESVARFLYKLMAYKDEFELARLHSDPAFLAQRDAQFKHGYNVKYNLAPPALSKRDPVTGELQKRQFGGWMFGAFKGLAHFKGLRGGALDIFGKTEERRHERQMTED